MLIPIQYPHVCSVFTNAEATRDGNGNWIPGATESVQTFNCRAEPAAGNTKSIIDGPDGNKVEFSWILYCPLDTPALATGTSILVYDKMTLPDTVKRFSRGQFNVRIWL